MIRTEHMTVTTQAHKGIETCPLTITMLPPLVTTQAHKGIETS